MTQLPEIDSLEALHRLYGTPAESTNRKVTPTLTPAYRAWIERARFCVLSTIGPEGSDGSPRGDAGPVVRILDAQTLALPDWHGNERIVSLRNIQRDGRVSLMFMIAGSTNVIRVNGDAYLTAAPDLCESFAHEGKLPRTVAVIRIAEVYRALIRSALWQGDQSAGLPTVGQIMSEITSGGFDGEGYDRDWPARAAKTMW